MNVLQRTLLLVGSALALGLLVTTASAREIRWGTSQVGTSGHRSMTTLAEMLKKEMPEWQVTVQPTPGAIFTVKGYATGEVDGLYGSDIAFYELANNINRFQGFKANMKREPVQSFWAFTIETGIGISSKDVGKFKGWRELTGKRVFTGPRPFDTRAHIERAFGALSVKHEYLEVALETAGSLLDGGRIAAMCIYSNALSGTAPWIQQASIETDWSPLNPSPEEMRDLKAAGFQTLEVPATIFGLKKSKVDKAVVLPFYYGFHVGLDAPEAEVYKFLKTVEAKAAEMVKTDPSYEQVRKDMAGMQRRGVESSVTFVPVHPGLARYMREKGVWDAKWDSRIAKAK